MSTQRRNNPVVSCRRRSRYYRRGYNKKPEDDVLDYMDVQDDHDDHRHDEEEEEKEEDDHGDMKAISQPKVDYWPGYYDFLINEGSYKFWAVFQVSRIYIGST